VVGSVDPARDCQTILDHLDGIMLHQLAFPDADFDPHRQIAGLIRALVPS
jgi:hypothetical protein